MMKATAKDLHSDSKNTKHYAVIENLELKSFRP